MKKSTYLIHYDEIGLKGKNRLFFEKKLVQNLKKQAKNRGFSVEVKNLWGRIISSSSADNEALGDLFKKTAGIAWYAKCKTVPADIEKIKEVIAKLAKKDFSSFAIRAKVPSKDFFLKRKELEEKLGSFVVEKFAKKVDLENPELTFFVEAYSKDKVFVYSKKKKCLGGLPVGSAGKGLSLISGGIDSPVASFLMFNRGLALDFVHFHSYPKTDKGSLEKAKRLAGKLSFYQPETNLYLVPILSIQQELFSKCNHKYLVLLYRRLMLKIAQQIAREKKLNCLITGDCLSQVASQTVENISVQNQAVEMSIFRPIISFNKEKVITQAKKIDSFEISIEPHTDCCSLFVPKHPETKAKLKDIIREEQKVDIEKMIKKAITQTEVVNSSRKKQ